MYYPVYVSIKSSLVSSPLETLSEFSQGGILLICAKCKLTDPLCFPLLPSGWYTRVWNAKQCITLSPNGGYLGAPYVRGVCGIEEFHKRVIKLTPTHTPFKHPLGMCKVGIEEFSSIWTSLAPPELHWCVCKISMYTNIICILRKIFLQTKLLRLANRGDWGWWTLLLPFIWSFSPSTLSLFGPIHSQIVSDRLSRQSTILLCLRSHSTIDRIVHLTSEPCCKRSSF